MADAKDTLVRLFCDCVAAHSPRTALFIPAEPGQFQAISWREFAGDVRQTAALLVRLGVKPGDRVVQVSDNRYEWILLDLAIHLVRGVHVAIHAVLSEPQIAFQIADCRARLAFLGPRRKPAASAGPNGGGAENVAPDSNRLLPEHLTYVALDPVQQPSKNHLPESFWELLRASTDDPAETDLEKESLRHVRPDDLATILYTSGTTGEPKGVMLSHRNLATNARATTAAFEFEPDDLRLCWLPLSHIFARTCDLYTWLASGTKLALAEGRDQVLANCQSLHPTLLNGVPYFFDKVRRHLVDAGEAEAAHGRLAQLFGGSMRFCSSGGAALPDVTAEFFWDRGIKLVQGYGLTESSPVITVATPSKYKLGTVGRAIEGVEVAIAADGEILTRGPHVMLGYWNRPDDTSEAIREGWLLTGDLGQLDEQGFLRITGRKKELIVTAAGKNVAPVLLENLLGESPLISQAVVFGDGRNFLTALIVPDPAALGEAIREQAVPVKSVAEALVHADILALYRKEIDARLCDLAEHEQIGRFTLINRGFSQDLGELTPTLKLRRATIAKHFTAEIRRLYEAD